MPFLPRWEVSWYCKNTEDIGSHLVVEYYTLEVVAIMAAWRHLKDGHTHVYVKEQHYLQSDADIFEWVSVSVSQVISHGQYRSGTLT